MKKFLIITLVIFYSVCGIAQTFKYEIIDGKNAKLSGKFAKAKDGYIFIEPEAGKKGSLPFFGGGNNNDTKYGLTVHKLNNEMEEISAKSLFDGEKKLLPWLYQVIDFNNKTYLIYHDIANKENSTVLKLMEIDRQTGEAKAEMSLVDFTKSKLEFDEKEIVKNSSRTFNIYISENRKKLMITSEAINAPEENKIINAWVFDENLKLIYEKKIDFKTETDKVNIYSILCDNVGNIFIAYRQYYGVDKKNNILGKNGKKVTSAVQDDMKKILIIQPDNMVQKMISLNMEAYSVYNMGLSYSALQNKVFILGAYTDAWNDNIIGLFQGSIDLSTMNVTAIDTTSFSTELVDKITQDGFAKKNPKKYGLLRNFALSYPVREDGTVDILMQYIETETELNQRNPNRGTSLTFIGGDFIVGHLVAEKFQFVRVPRYITSAGNNTYIMCSTLSIGDNLMIFYNDNRRNTEQDIEQTPILGVVQKSEIYVAGIDKNDVVTRKRVLKDLDDKSIGLLGNIFTIDPRTFLVSLEHLNVMSMSTNKVQFAKVTVE